MYQWQHEKASYARILGQCYLILLQRSTLSMVLVLGTHMLTDTPTDKSHNATKRNVNTGEARLSAMVGHFIVQHCG